MPTLRRIVDAALEVTVAGSWTRLGIDARRALGPWDDLGACSLMGRVVVVTGATSGIGRAAAHRMAGMGATLAVVGRDPGKVAHTVETLRAETRVADSVRGYVADMADLRRVAELAAAIARDHDRVDALLHNAGAMLAERTVTAQGHEQTFSLMVLGPALLTESLLPLLEAAHGRVVLVSSGGMYAQRLDVDDPESSNGYRGAQAYAKAKRAQVVLAEEWARQWRDRDIVVHSMHPGWVETPGVRTALPRFEQVMRPLLRTPDDGADTLVWLAAADTPTHTSGRFWLDRTARSTYRVPGTREPAADRARLLELVHDAITPDALR